MGAGRRDARPAARADAVRAGFALIRAVATDDRHPIFGLADKPQTEPQARRVPVVIEQVLTVADEALPENVEISDEPIRPPSG